MGTGLLKLVSCYEMFSFSLSLYIYILTELWLIYNVLLISVVQQSDSVLHICIYSFFILLSIMVYHRILNIVFCAI